VTDAETARRRRWKRPRVAMLLVLALLAPLTALAALTGGAAVSSRAQHRVSVRVEQDSAALGALMAARALVINEYVPSAALASSAAFKISPAQVKKIFGLDYPAMLHAARPLVDANAALRSSPVLAADLNKLQRLRPSIGAGGGDSAVIVAFFSRFVTDVDHVWRARFTTLRHDVEALSGRTGVVAQRVDALSASFAVLSDAMIRAVATGAVVTGPGTPASVKPLIQANGEFAAHTAGFPADLGPRAAAAWRTWVHDPKSRAWEQTVAQTVTTALAGRPSPLATNSIVYGIAFTKEPHWLNDLTAVIEGASTDMRAVARSEAASAARSYRDEVVVFVLSVLIAAGATVLLARAVVSPLRRLATSARRVAEGDFAVQAVRPSGPREVADTIRAVDEMTAVFGAVEAFTVTLAEDPSAASLDVPLPGRTGRALQTTLNRLRESVRDAERQRAVLHEMATHDSLTGLLNRQAARSALDRELRRASRESRSVMMLYVDLDDLKAINDTYGHKVGDDAIRLTARALSSAARRSDIVARLGGDEFLVAGPAAAHQEVQALADRLRDGVAAEQLAAGDTIIPLRCSIGMSYSESVDDVDSLVQKADQALYTAKMGGRDRSAWHELSAASGAFDRAPQ
jgi:diguanylate cyclase (GGDEF)-like protein